MEKAKLKTELDCIRELLVRASTYDDKPHQLFSWIRHLAERFEPDPQIRREIIRLMDREYSRSRTKESRSRA